MDETLGNFYKGKFRVQPLFKDLVRNMQLAFRRILVYTHKQSSLINVSTTYREILPNLKVADTNVGELGIQVMKARPD